MSKANFQAIPLPGTICKFRLVDRVQESIDNDIRDQDGVLVVEQADNVSNNVPPFLQHVLLDDADEVARRSFVAAWSNLMRVRLLSLPQPSFY